MRLKLLLGFIGFFSVNTALFAQIPHVVVGDSTDDWSWETGNDLFNQCTSGEHSDDFHHCLTYIRGAVDMIGALQGARGTDEKSFWKLTAVCMPSHATSGQVVDVVVKYLKDNPKDRADKAGWIIIRALIQAWGCPAASK
jgi:hypothetical protein